MMHFLGDRCCQCCAISAMQSESVSMYMRAAMPIACALSNKIFALGHCQGHAHAELYTLCDALTSLFNFHIKRGKLLKNISLIVKLNFYQHWSTSFHLLLIQNHLLLLNFQKERGRSSFYFFAMHQECRRTFAAAAGGET